MPPLHCSCFSRPCSITNLGGSWLLRPLSCQFNSLAGLNTLSIPCRFFLAKSAMSFKNTEQLSTSSEETPNLENHPLALTYPTPLSPPFPFISKEIELSRAMTASSKSGLFSLSRNDVIFEDEWLIVVNKPRGIYCESVLSSAPSLLGDSVGVPELHLANRLDRDTSGVMVITKSNKIAAKLVKAFTEHKVKKTYVAHCIGLAPKWDKMRIKSGHGRSKFGAWRVYAASDVGLSLPGGSMVRDMETVFEVLSVNGQGRICANSDEFENVLVAEEKKLVVETGDGVYDEILVRAFPRSGRTHQIRLHCHFLGIPIKGDVKYHGVHTWNGNTCDGHLLHAESLSLEHPVSGLPVLYQAPLPSWAKEAFGTYIILNRGVCHTLG